MSGNNPAELAERRALLVTRAHLDRARMTLAVHQIRGLVFPASDSARSARLRPTAAAIVGIAVPLLGTSRAVRFIRIASFALTAYRIARNWRAPNWRAPNWRSPG
jgi:hypothetical protein